MGCGASAKSTATAVGTDTVQVVAGVGGAAVQTAGHGVAAAVLSVADILTFGQIDSIGDWKDDQIEDMVDSAGDTWASVEQYIGKEEYFGDTPTEKQFALQSEWLKKVPDSTPVVDLFIPGTHDTMANKGGALATCQNWSIADQLKAGIRAIDIRAKHSGDDLKIYHGIIDQEADFNDCVAACEAFLEAHSSEVIFLRLRREGESGEHKKVFHDEVMERLHTDKVKWRTDIASWPTLGECRGQIIFLAQGSHVKLFKQVINVQDEWNTGDEEVKVAAIKEHAVAERFPGWLFMSYCSATGMNGNICYKAPGALAYQVNKSMNGLIDAEFKCGIYMLDYPGTGLVNKFIRRNPGCEEKAAAEPATEPAEAAALAAEPAAAVETLTEQEAVNPAAEQAADAAVEAAATPAAELAADAAVEGAGTPAAEQAVDAAVEAAAV